MREEDKLLAGILFWPLDPELKAMKLRAHKLSQEYNGCREDETEKRAAILERLLGAFGERSFLQGPIYFHYGRHTHIGKSFFGNFNLTVQDDAPVHIGDHCDFGPNVSIVTPLHPMLPEERRRLLDAEGNEKRLCYADPSA